MNFCKSTCKLSALNGLVEMATCPYTFSIESMIRGYHEYGLIWNNPIVGEELICERELGNSHDPYAVATRLRTAKKQVYNISEYRYHSRYHYRQPFQNHVQYLLHNFRQSTKFWRVKPWRIDVLFAKVLHRQRFPLYGRSIKIHILMNYCHMYPSVSTFEMWNSIGKL